MSEPVHVRTIRVEAFPVGANELEVTGVLLDERPRGAPWWGGEDGGGVVHDMTVTLRVRYPDFVITGATGKMASHPYTICPEAVPALEQLVGLSVARGFIRSVQERFGRERGCAHLTALILAMAPAVKQAAGAAFRNPKGAHPRAQASGVGPPREHPAHDTRWFVNTCHAWREDGPLHSLLERGGADALRAMSARRPARVAKDQSSQGGSI